MTSILGGESDDHTAEEAVLPTGGLIPFGFAGRQEDWQLRVRGRWSAEERILRLEGRGAIVGVRHVLRCAENRGQDHLVLGDNLSLVLALSKGRAADPELNQTRREPGALRLPQGQ
eukprot:4340441-Pyramimonas_sp.AAC.1